MGLLATVNVRFVSEPAAGEFPESSKPLILIVIVPAVTGIKLKDQLSVPAATSHVVPPSSEYSIPATIPSTSVAVPLTVTDSLFVTVELFAGDVIVSEGAVISVDLVAATISTWSVSGCTSMSARRFTVACCILILAAALPPS